MEDLRNESSSTIKNKRSANIRGPFDIIEGFGLPSGAKKTDLQLSQ
jgi:hypothetical protein